MNTPRIVLFLVTYLAFLPTSAVVAAASESKSEIEQQRVQIRSMSDDGLAADRTIKGAKYYPNKALN